MMDFRQMPLFEDTNGDIAPSDEIVENTNDSRDLGTFKDNKRAPIHNWFQYPAGYSYNFVDMMFRQFDVNSGDWVYDPFSGTGTTLVFAKQNGINGHGVEAHSFVHWVADVKLYWEYDFTTLGYRIEQLLMQCRNTVAAQTNDVDLENKFPELIYKCYHIQDLTMLYLLREFIVNCIVDEHIQNLFKLALTQTLRSSAAAGTGWPYIAPNKNTGDKPPKNALRLFEKTVRKMYSDLLSVRLQDQDCEIHNVLGDSRNQQSLDNNQVKLALTSPPYLNNYDYGDRTRLETYFWGITSTWKEITQGFRDKLLVAATTQVTRGKHNVETVLSQQIAQLDSQLYQTIQDSVLQLARLRNTKGGKKDYDLMVALYFNGMLPVLQETYRVLQPGGIFCLVLGDSAPYGVHLQTELLIGKLGLAVGFQKYDYQEFRIRGGKWKNNPQRHKVPLHEGMLILTK